MHGATFLVVRWWFWIPVTLGYCCLGVLGTFLAVVFPVGWLLTTTCPSGNDCTSYPGGFYLALLIIFALCVIPCCLASIAAIVYTGIDRQTDKYPEFVPESPCNLRRSDMETAGMRPY